jgi:hypothetical protein
MKKFFAVMVSFVFVMMAHAQFANATPTLYVSIDGGSTWTSAAATLSNGSYSYNTTAGAWTQINGSFTPATSATSPDLDLLSFVASSSTGGTLDLAFIDDGLGPFDGAVVTGVGGTDNTSGDSGLFATYLNSVVSGSTITTGTQIGGNITYSVPGNVNLPYFFGGNTSGGANAGASSNLELFASITHAGSGKTSFDDEARVPEPGTLLLLGIGLLAFALVSTKIAKQNS